MLGAAIRGQATTIHAVRNLPRARRAVPLAVGATSLRDTTSGLRNTAVGFAALDRNTEGYENTAIGADALGENTTGRFNTAVGRLAMRSNTTGKKNTATRVQALSNNTTGNGVTTAGAAVPVLTTVTASSARSARLVATRKTSKIWEPRAGGPLVVRPGDSNHRAHCLVKTT